MAISCSTNDEGSAAGDQYTCPMHPTVVSATQGSCPVCGMDLVRKVRAGEELKITEDLARILQSPDEAVVAEVPTIRGTFRRMPITVEAQGVVTYDTRFIHDLPARVGGRLERVYLRYALQPVKRGQKIADIYSPEMLTAQKELLFLVTNDPENELRLKAAREKLLLLGASSAQIDELLQNGTPLATFAVYSAYDGYVIEPQSAVPPTTQTATQTAGAAGGSGMEGSTASPSQPAMKPTGIREGAYVSRGQTLFTIANRDALRAEVSIPFRQAGRIRVGDVATMDSDAGHPVSARVDMVQPFYAEGEQFLKVRLYVNQPAWRIGQLVRASLKTESPEALWLPTSSVYDLGTTQLVFVKERGLFKPRTVVTGERADGWIEIRNGLASSEDVARQAAYLVDSESFIKTRLTK